MLVQSCPVASTGGLGIQSGGLNLQSGGLPNGLAAFQGSAYCGLAPSSDSSEYSSSSMQDISLPNAQQDLVNGNRVLECEEEEEEFNKQKRRGSIGGSDRNSPGFLQVESDILVTESQVLNIETTITETFTVNSNEMPNEFDLRSGGVGENSEGLFGGRCDGKISTALDSLDIYSDRFEKAFEFEGKEEEDFEGMAMSPGSLTSSLSSVRSKKHEEEIMDGGRPALLGEDQKKSCLEQEARAEVGVGGEKVFEDAKHDSGFEEGFKVGDQEAQKVKVKEEVKAKEVKLTVKGLETVKVNLSKEVEVERSSGHRVTFNDQNEVASQDRDGTFKVTYRQLGERLRRGEGDEPGRVESRLREEGKRAAALRCVVAERSKVENVVGMPLVVPRTIDFDTCSYDDLADYALPSEKREMEREQGEWDNPFQPEGEVSQDAEVIVQLWKGGRLCQDSLAADLASAAASAESTPGTSPGGTPVHHGQGGTPVHHGHGSLNGSLAASPGVSPKHSTSPPPSSSSSGGGGEETHLASTSSPAPPLRSGVPSTTQLVISEKQKHKNKLKKHCSMM